MFAPLDKPAPVEARGDAIAPEDTPPEDTSPEEPPVAGPPKAIEQKRATPKPAPQPQPVVTAVTAGEAFFAGPQGAKVRPLPSLDYEELVRLPAKTRLNVTGQAVVNGRKWYRVALADDVTGFVRSDVIVRTPSAPDDGQATSVEGDTPSTPLRTGAAGARVRVAPARDAREIVRLPPDTALKVTGSRQVGGYTWYRVRLSDGREGYVRQDVVK